MFSAIVTMTWRLRSKATSFGATYRAPLGERDLSVHITGPTGLFKTEVAALFQAPLRSGLGRAGVAHDHNNWH